MTNPVTSGVVTDKMGLTKWTASTDAYNHSQLATNLELIDEHDHSPGKGNQLSANALAPNSVTHTQLADNAVTSTNIADGTIAIQDLSPALLELLQPVGTVIQWYRPNTGVSLPNGWVPMDGRTLTASEHAFTGGGTIVLPDARNCFVLGAATSGTGTGATTPPVIGANGGSHTRDLRHTHNVASHSHGGTTEAAGAVANAVGTLTTSATAPGTDTQGSHHHTWNGGQPLHQRPYEISDGSNGVRQGAYVPGFNIGGTDALAPMEDVGSHSHTVNAHTHDVPSHAHSVSAHSHVIDAEAPVTGNPNSTLTATTDLRPAYVGLLLLMKVKY